MAARIFAFIFELLITLGMTCLAVLCITAYLAIDWSFILCLGVWMIIWALRWAATGAKDGME